MNSKRKEEVQKVLLALLVSEKNPVKLSQLEGYYVEEEGEQIPWRALGYVSLLNFLQSMPTFFEIRNLDGLYYVKGIASEKSKHVSSLVARQKVSKKHISNRKSFRPSHYFPKTAPPRIHISADILSEIVLLIREYPNGLNKDYVLNIVNQKMSGVNISMDELQTQLRELSHEIAIEDNMFFPVSSRTNHFSNSKPKETIDVTADKRIDALLPPRYCVSGTGESGSEDSMDDDDFSFVPSGYIPHGSTRDKRSLTIKKPICNFIQDTVSKCQSQTVDLSIQYDNAKCEVQCNTQLNEDLTSIDKGNEGCDGTNKENVTMLINNRIKFRLKKLIEKYPNGIWCAELPEKYLEEYKISLNYIELGFNSVREFASHLPEIFHFVQPCNTGDFILYDVQSATPQSKKEERSKLMNLAELHQMCMLDDDVEILPSIVSSDTCKKLIPDGVMTLGESVGQINVVDLANNIKPYIEVFVVEVFTPSFFWIQLRKKQKIFDAFMKDLHNFYTAESENYVIPPVVLEKGLNCACIYNDIWHRGLIKQVTPELQVTVMFYDYGTLKTYPAEDIYYLHRSFSYLPAQAIPCGLVNTKPCVGEKWSKSVTHQFAIRTSEIPLVATIASIDGKNNSMMVTLTDTLEDEDVHINDWLVQQRLAVHGKMVRIRPRNFPFSYYLQCRERMKNRDATMQQTHAKEKKERLGYDSHIPFNHESSTSMNTPQNNAKELRTSSSVKTVSSKTQISKEFITLYKELRNVDCKASTLVNNNSPLTRDPTIGRIDSDDRFNFTRVFKKSDNVCKHTEKRGKGTDKNRNDAVQYGSYISTASPNKENVYIATKTTTQLQNGPENTCDDPGEHGVNDEVNDDIKNFNEYFQDRNHVEPIDWTLIRSKIDNSESETVMPKEAFKEPHETYIKERKNTSSIKSSFLRFVYNTKYSKNIADDVDWLPEGNVGFNVEDSAETEMRRDEIFKSDDSENVTITVPRNILEILRGNTASTAAKPSDGLHKASPNTFQQEPLDLLCNSNNKKLCHTNSKDNNHMEIIHRIRNAGNKYQAKEVESGSKVCDDSVTNITTQKEFEDANNKKSDDFDKICDIKQDETESSGEMPESKSSEICTSEALLSSNSLDDSLNKLLSLDTQDRMSNKNDVDTDVKHENEKLSESSHEAEVNFRPVNEDCRLLQQNHVIKNDDFEEQSDILPSTLENCRLSSVIWKERILRNLMKSHNTLNDVSEIDSDDLTSEEEFLDYQCNSENKLINQIHSNDDSDVQEELVAKDVSIKNNIKIESNQNLCEAREEVTIPIDDRLSTYSSDVVKETNEAEVSRQQDLLDITNETLAKDTLNGDIENAGDEDTKIPVFNDIDVESDDEEWDAYAEPGSILKMLNIPQTIDAAPDTDLKIVEVDDSDIKQVENDTSLHNALSLNTRQETESLQNSSDTNSKLLIDDMMHQNFKEKYI